MVLVVMRLLLPGLVHILNKSCLKYSLTLLLDGILLTITAALHSILTRICSSSVASDVCII